MKLKMIAALAATLAFTQVAFGAHSQFYPGATRMADRGGHANPNYAVMYSTPDTYAKVVDYYK